MDEYLRALRAFDQFVLDSWLGGINAEHICSQDMPLGFKSRTRRIYLRLDAKLEKKRVERLI